MVMLIKVKVKTAAKKKLVEKRAEDEFVVSVKARPEAGRANEEVLLALAEYLETERKKLRIIKGGKNRSKIIEIV